MPNNNRKKIQLYRNKEIYTPSAQQGLSALEVAKNNLAGFSLSDGEVVIGRYQETNQNVKTVIAVAHDMSNNNDGMTFFTDSSDFVSRPVVLYQTDGTTGLLGVNEDELGSDWQLENYDFTPYKYLRCYFKMGNFSTTNPNLTPSMVIELPLETASKSKSAPSGDGQACDMYVAGGVAPNPSDPTTVLSVLVAVDSTKTKFQVVYQNMYDGWQYDDNYSNSPTEANNNGRFLYKIEGCFDALNNASEIEYMEHDPIFTASPAYGITSSDITNWNGKTSNVGTVTAVKMNNTTKEPDSNGVVDLGTVITRQDMDTAISEMEAQIEAEQLTVMVGENLAIWLDPDGESINFMPTAANPAITANPTLAATYNGNSASVAISNVAQGATIYYTTDGTTPTTSSNEWTNIGTPLTINSACIVKVIAHIEGQVNGSASLNIAQCDAPTISTSNNTNTSIDITATGATGDTVTMTIGGDSVTNPATINKTASAQALTVVATASNNSKLSNSTTQIVNVDAKVYGATHLVGKCLSDNPITFYNYTTAVGTVTPVATGETNENNNPLYEFDLDWGSGNINQYSSGGKNILDSSTNDTNIVSIDHIPSGWTNLPAAAFRYFSVLKNVVIPSNITTLGNRCFRDCTSLQHLVIPSSVTSIGKPSARESFITGCSSLTRIDVLSDNISLEDWQFCGAASLAAITFSAVIPPTATSTTFSLYPTTDNAYNIYVPDNSVNDYKAAENWSSIATRIKPINELTTE